MFVRLSMKLVSTLYLSFVGMESVPRAGPEANHDIINKNIAVTTAAARFSTPPPGVGRGEMEDDVKPDCARKDSQST